MTHLKRRALEIPSTFSKNLVINSHLSAGGDIHIGDIIYNVHEDFAHSILFLVITRSGTGHVANLALKTKHQRLCDQAVGMLQQAIELQIPDSLFRQVDQFQASRRKLEGNRYHNAYGMEPIVLEATLSQLLYDQFFAGDIGEVVRNFLQALEARKITDLLLVIASPEEDIRNLPLEMVLDRLVPKRDGVLHLQGFGFVRTMEQNLDGFNMSGIPIEAAPLKMLFITALPEDLPEKSKHLELEDEQKKLIDAVGALEATGDNKPKMVIEFLDVASLEEIKKALQARHHDVVHISGHGQYFADLEQGFLYLETDEGDTAKTEGAELAAALRGLRHVKLLVLSACQTAMAGKGGTAEALATSGIPAVLAMRFSVLDAGAKVFTTAFYTALAKGRSITESMAAGRAKLLEQVQTHREYEPEYPAEWFTPVLYLNQYVAELVDMSRYQFPQDFYTHGQFLKEAHTRLIGSGFIGRKKQRIQMRRAFRDRKSVCLVGLGGMGKTTLAEAFARNFGNQSHRIIIWRGENEITELGILNRIVEEFRTWQPTAPLLGRLKGIVENAEMRILKRLDYLINNCLASEKVILIFDNFEDLIWQEGDADARTIVDEGVREMLNYLLVNAPEHCRVMFTSRYQIEGLVGDVFFLDSDKLSVAEQYRLMNFSEVLRAIGSAERERIYARLDGLPRAFGFLEGLVRNDPAFSWDELENALGQVEAKVFADLMLGRIYGLLSEELQRVFLVASVFFTRTPVGALVAVTGDEEVLGKLEMLLRWGLCYLDLEKGEFEVHALTREWVAKTGLLDLEERRNIANQIGSSYIRNNPNLGDIKLAIGYYEIAQNWDEYSRLASSLQRELSMRGFMETAMAICEEAIQKDLSLYSNASFLNYLGILYLQIEDYENARHFLHNARLRVRPFCEDDPAYMELLLAIQGNLAHIYQRTGDYDSARELTESIFEETNDPEVIVATCGNLAMIMHEKGLHDEALDQINRCLLFAESMPGNESVLHCSTCFVNRSRILTKLKQFEEARTDSMQAIGMKTEIGDHVGLASAYHGMGVSYYDQGMFSESVKWFVKSFELYEKLDLPGKRSPSGYLDSIIDKLGKDEFQEILKSLSF